jgi:ATP-dependent DNA ligase
MASIKQEIKKKEERRKKEKIQDFDTHFPVAPKKPCEFKFEKEDTVSFEYPIAIGNTIAEKKSDGFCVHVYKTMNDIKLYSSQSNEWNPECFPEIIKGLAKQPNGYYHGEILGINPGTGRFTSLDEFTAIQKRPKLNSSDLTRELLETYPLKLDIFDVLVMDNKILAKNPLSERRYALEQRVQQGKHINLIQQWNVGNKEELQKLFLDVIDMNYEGLIAKDPDSLYIPGSRDTDWIKLKEFTTLDLAVLGFYSTPESYNSDTKMFETVAKVKVGSKTDQDEIYSKVSHLLTDKANNIVLNDAMYGIERKIPEQIVQYASDIAVIEVQTQDITHSETWHSCGLENGKAHSLRIPTFKQVRKDKSRVQDVTTTQQIKEYYAG